MFTTKRYYQLAGTQAAVRNSSTGQLTYLLGDQLGSTTVAVNASTGATSTQRFLPYGAPRSGSISATDRGWIGQTKDGSTGLQYLNARYYDPAIGRFTGVDPIVDRGRPISLDRFGYGDASPVTKSDPTGLRPLECDQGWDGDGPSKVGGGWTVTNPPPPPKPPTPPGKSTGLSLKNPNDESADELAKKAGLAGDVLDAAETGLEVCGSRTCLSLVKATGMTGNVAGSVELVAECRDGIDGDCAAIAAEWGVDAVFLTGGPGVAVAYLYVKHVGAPLIGRMLAALQEQTPGPGQPALSDHSFTTHAGPDGHTQCPSGGSNYYQCESGLPAGFGVC